MVSTLVPAVANQLESWDFAETNAAQSYATHGFFRYFGKLPPAVTSRILEEARPRSGPVLDIMCGSGTTLVESRLKGIDSVGVDVNPLSLLVSEVKTTRYDIPALQKAIGRFWEELDQQFVSVARVVPKESKRKESGDLFQSARVPIFHKLQLPEIRNINYWFAPEVQQQLAVLRDLVDCLPEGAEKNFLRVGFLSIVRRVSNASPRIGRIFYRGVYGDKDVDVVFKQKIGEMLEGAADFAMRAKANAPLLLRCDARSTSLESESCGTVVCHPPYFALYKYSSDVLRFELAWGGFDRKPIADGEIVDGFKTTDRALFDHHIADMRRVMAESYRVLAQGGALVIITSNSTLRDERLPVVDRLLEEATASGIGFTLRKVVRRSVKFAQASYHRSARQDKVTAEDFILFLQK